MPEPRRLMSVISGTLAVVAWIALAPMPAHALTAKQVRALLSSQHGVKVLKLRSTVRNGRAVFIATVMNAGGDFNWCRCADGCADFRLPPPRQRSGFQPRAVLYAQSPIGGQPAAGLHLALAAFGQDRG